MRYSLFLLIASAAITMAAEAISVASPDGRIRFELSPRFEYSISLSGKAVIERSPLAITVDGVRLSDGAVAGKPVKAQVKESYAWYGNHTPASVACNAVSIPVKGRSAYTIEVRACNSGVAFRHIVPGKGPRIPDEATAFRIPAGGTVWYHDTEGHYEALHVRKQIADVPADAWAAPPVTIQLPGGAGYAAITEGALFRYAGMVLQADGKGGFAARLGHAVPPSYPFRLRYKNDIERVSKPAAIEGTITTPWRVVVASADLNGLVNADLVSSLAPPPDPKVFPTTAWIKPGRAVWKYLDGGENTLETAREFSRLAAELGFEYQVLEGFWQKWPPEELKAFIAESRNQGIGIWLWKHSNQLRTPEARKQFFDLVADAGAAGVKIDFFDHEAKEVVEQYEILLREAAARKLLVNFHGANKPTGESRTYPNELTREAVRGMESRKSDRAAHDATLPFTRFLAGHADYTPMHFGDRRNDTTWAHQIATAVLFTSPLLTYAAHPKNILSNPAVDVIKAIPSVWDETVVLPVSKMGEVAAFARRKGADWFVAIANGTEAKTLQIPVGFLADGEYNTTLVRDGEEPASIIMERTKMNARNSLNVRLSPGGGFVGRFTQ